MISNVDIVLPGASCGLKLFGDFDHFGGKLYAANDLECFAIAYGSAHYRFEDKMTFGKWITRSIFVRMYWKFQIGVECAPESEWSKLDVVDYDPEYVGKYMMERYGEQTVGDVCATVSCLRRLSGVDPARKSIEPIIWSPSGEVESMIARKRRDALLPEEI
jgi:hypothetical protein